MKTIMIPIQPKYAELEMNGKKTIEVRKFYIEPPFKVCNYVTYGMLLYSEYPNGNDSREVRLGKFKVTSKNHMGHQLNGTVAFEYVVNKVDEIPPCETHNGIHYPLISRPELAELVKKACLSHDELFLYGVKKNQGCYGANSKVVKLYAMHISDLIIYDKPKEISDFHKPFLNGVAEGIKRSPQNFVYVEEIKCYQSEEGK